jgi:2-polyprenyl-6-methoxyphenol hydroxylase-like FAD-dependent oxidoreductase
MIARMSRIIVLGGSVAGLLCGMQLARRGHDVTVLEREPQAAVARPADALPVVRPGAPHAVQGHVVLARAAAEIRRALPDVYAALLAAGVGEFDLAAAVPAAIADRAPRAGDDDLVALQTSRHTLDRVLVEAAQSTPQLDLRFGTPASGLVIARDGSAPPRVTGVQTAGGEALAADAVVDASGRRTPVPGWLAAHGIELPIEALDVGLVYFTRHYRLRPGATRPPLNRFLYAGGDPPSLLVRWFPADNGTAMLAHIVLAEDRLLKAVRHPARFEAVARVVPDVAPWLECADPITEVFGMGALQNTLRRVVRDGRPVVLGLHLIGDAACTTNPLLGRGISLAAVAAAGVADALAAEPHDPVAQALRLEDVLAREIEPRFGENAAFDRAVVLRLRADLAGEPPPAPPPPADDALRPEELLLGGMQDADLYRVWTRYAHLLADGSLLSDPAVFEHVRRLVPPGTRPPAPVGPTRAELAKTLAAA